MRTQDQINQYNNDQVHVEQQNNIFSLDDFVKFQKNDLSIQNVENMIFSKQPEIGKYK